MLLAARALGLGSTLTTRHLLYEKETEAGAGAAAGGAFLRDPADRLADGEFRPGRAREAGGHHLPRPVGGKLRLLMRVVMELAFPGAGQALPGVGTMVQLDTAMTISGMSGEALAPSVAARMR